METERSQIERVGPYRPLKPLGKGGMSVVFLANDDRNGNRVAVKRFRGEADLSEKDLLRFRREAQALAKINHPNIVKVHEFLKMEKGEYIVMEYVPGRTLEKCLLKGALPVRETVSLARDIADGLVEAHRQEVIHRDLKPQNIIVTKLGRAKIFDFGLAKQISESDLTVRGELVGSWRYMSPEQASAKPVDHRTDLFSFGILIYEMCCGEAPFSDESPFVTLDKIREAEYTSLSSRLPENPDLADLVDRMLKLDPDARPDSADDVLADLEDISLDLGDAGGEAMPLSQLVQIAEDNADSREYPIITMPKEKDKQRSRKFWPFNKKKGE